MIVNGSFLGQSIEVRPPPPDQGTTYEITLNLQRKGNMDHTLKKIVQDQDLVDMWMHNISESYVKGLRSRYLKNEKQNAALILYGAHMEPKAFLLAYKTSETQIHIDLIGASKGYGNIMMNTFLRLCDSIGLHVDLDSLAHVLLYYPKFGFEYRSGCNSPKVELPKRILQKMQNQVQRKQNPKNGDEAYENRTWFEAMKVLHNNNLSVRKTKKCSKPCTDKKCDFIYENNCATDGYMMYRCTSDKTKLDNGMRTRFSRRSKKHS